MLPDDVERFISRKFASADQRHARLLLESAVIHDGSPATPRLLRCAAIASNGFVERLLMEIASLKRDYHDVIVDGEYEPAGSRLMKVRDLNNPIPDEA
jgi:hypothetical protein